MSIQNVGPQNNLVPQMPDMTPPPAQEKDAVPQAPAGGSDVVELNVPVTLPKEMFVPDKEGKKQIDDYQMQLIKKDAVVTDHEEIKDLVEKVKVQTFNNGLPEAANSTASKLMATGKAIGSQAAMMGAGFANCQLMSSSPAGWAGPVAILGGTVGLMNAADGIKKTFDAKAYYKALQAQGKETMTLPVTMKDGTVVEQEVKLDDLIKGANEGLVVQGMQAVGNTLMVAAGFGAGPAAAMAGLAVQLGAMAYMSRHAVAAFLKKVGGHIKNAAISLKDKITHVKDRNSAKEQASQAKKPEASGEALTAQARQLETSGTVKTEPPKQAQVSDDQLFAAL